jgi:hypothetical protein
MTKDTAPVTQKPRAKPIEDQQSAPQASKGDAAYHAGVRKARETCGLLLCSVQNADTSYMSPPSIQGRGTFFSEQDLQGKRLREFDRMLATYNGPVNKDNINWNDSALPNDPWECLNVQEVQGYVTVDGHRCTLGEVAHASWILDKYESFLGHGLDLHDIQRQHPKANLKCATDAGIAYKCAPLYSPEKTSDSGAQVVAREET